MINRNKLKNKYCIKNKFSFIPFKDIELPKIKTKF